MKPSQEIIDALNRNPMWTELETLLNEPGVDGFMYVVFRGKESASVREFGNIYPENIKIQQKEVE